MSVRSTLPPLLEKILSLPTAPFHERFVSSFVQAELKGIGVDPRLDRYGNIVAACGRREGRVALVAHMDHPGFEVVEAAGKRVEAAWFGGVAPKFFAGSRVVVYRRGSGDVGARGVVERIVQNPQGRVERMTLRVRGDAKPGDFGTWDLVPFRRRGELIHTKGADDLVGCAVILATLRELKRRGIDAGVTGIFTRAEEQGFIGTLGLIDSGRLPLRTRIISIETSKALPGIALGGGPVIRLGDRTSMFHYQMVLFMEYVARETQKARGDFVYQRRVMDGGTCEATPFQLRGYMAGGMAIPLHNYHNQGSQGIRPEAVHLRDVESAVRFLIEMVSRTAAFEVPGEEIHSRWGSALKKYGEKLQRQ